MPGSRQENCIEIRTTYNTIFNYVKNRLSPVRFRHSVAVGKLAQKLCLHYNIDAAKGLIAGIAHDIAREWDDSATLDFLQAQGVVPGNWERKRPVVMHGVVGALLLDLRFGIGDPEILAAVRNHVLGRPAMGLLSQILYVADFLEPTRGFFTEKRRREYLSLPIAEMLVKVTDEIFVFLEGEGKPIAPCSKEMYEYFTALGGKTL